MRTFSNQYQIETGTQTGNFWLFILKWLQLLVLSLSRISDFLSAIFLDKPDNNLPQLQTTDKIIKNKSLKMKTKNKNIKWAFMLLLLVCSTATSFGQVGPYPFTADDIVCQNITKSYGVNDVTTSNFAWTISPGVDGTDWKITKTANNTIDVKW